VPDGTNKKSFSRTSYKGITFIGARELPNESCYVSGGREAL
jgi:hypothetical protein